MSISYGGDKITFDDGTTIASGLSHRNRIINGAMEIDQRNAGAAVTSHLAFPVDRFQLVKDTGAGTISVQQSTTAPTGFKNSIIYTVGGTAFSPSSLESNFIKQIIEGTNVADLGWGTASAKTVTLSFWVRSSLTGTFGGSVRNSAANRSYVFSYTINAQNTWEYKTITVPGDTSGTWLTTTGNGIELSWAQSVGSSRAAAAGSWYGDNYIGVTGATSITGNANSNWYITGVQLEVGSYATTFERRPFGTELQLCQRYFEKTYDYSVAIGTATENGWEWIGTDCSNVTTTGTLQSQRPRFSVTKRTQPTITVWDALGNSGKATRYYVGSGPSSNHTCTTDLITTNAFRVFVAGTTTTTNGAFHWAANAEL